MDEEKKNVNKNKTKGKGKRYKKKGKKIIFVILIVVLIVTVSYLSYLIYVHIRDKKLYSDLQENIDSINNDETVNDEKIQQVIDQVKEMQQENGDVKGWIQINDTKINYPLLQGTDNDYYLKRNYKKADSEYGSIFIDKSSDLNNDDSNVIIYGHNMKDGEMFQNLLNYSNKEFYDNHKIIDVYTNNEYRQYEIVTAFKSRIFYKNEKNVFRFYYCTDLSTEEKYNDYINNCKKIQLYDTGVDASYGEQLITLIVCEYSQPNGRMVVVAKRTA